ncbi:hypothetical protein AVEN_70522-1 [Araneus ventricosus]|uniref:Uncharacterized protein n=1 Tax=Araneus ventricosus TaxID=182803 RepID=A0A4Y2A3X1_ARAVE|nr:hypothetical protein AVEN_45184-1 [Araneus ventricosus]GBL74490.1 hypothetical protein AVEN_70522-1 [Araneus ventricosus]
MSFSFRCQILYESSFQTRFHQTSAMHAGLVYVKSIEVKRFATAVCCEAGSSVFLVIKPQLRGPFQSSERLSRILPNKSVDLDPRITNVSGLP